jgi:uncharacterized RDD family membrane protein YckC
MLDLILVCGLCLTVPLVLIIQQFWPGSVLWGSSPSEILNRSGIAAFYLLWVPVESLLIGYLGTTPGKWLMNIHVNDSTGGRLSSGKSLKRAALMFLRGLALGVPLVWLGTMAFSSRYLQRNGFTTWDRDSGSRLTFGPIGAARIIIIIAVAAAWVALMVIK